MTLDELRAERNRRLAETDHWLLPDINAFNAYVFRYRQQLRDLPAQEDLDLDNVAWPVKPEVKYGN